MKIREWIVEKLNPAQSQIVLDEGGAVQTDQRITYTQAFDKLETVNRGVNMIVSGVSGLDYDVKEKVVEGVVTGVKAKTLNQLLNFRPNPYQSTQDFRNNLFADFVLEGNMFIYWDGAFMYHLPANKVEILPDEVTYIKGFRYNSRIVFKPTEIIHVKDISNDSIYRGSSRLASAERSMKILYNMQQFQESFFENGAVPGLVLTTENTLSQVAKDKTIQTWITRYNPKSGAKRPMILDSGLKPSAVFETNFRELEFEGSVQSHDHKILKSLGVPPILLDGGNNANIAPNLRLFYLETIVPISKKLASAVERFFGYDIDVVTTNVSALQPELKDVASYLTTLVNGGVITPNEAREELRYEKLDGQDEIRVPANIAGSAADPSQGGAPKKPKETGQPSKEYHG